MNIIGEFEVYELFRFGNEKGHIALAGKLKSGGPLSYQFDILQKEIFVLFPHSGNEIVSRLIKLENGFSRFGLDKVIDVGDNAALVLEANPENKAFIQTTFDPTVVATIFIKK